MGLISLTKHEEIFIHNLCEQQMEIERKSGKPDPEIIESCRKIMRKVWNAK